MIFPAIAIFGHSVLSGHNIHDVLHTIQALDLPVWTINLCNKYYHGVNIEYFLGDIVRYSVACDNVTVSTLKELFSDHQIYQIPRRIYCDVTFTHMSPKVFVRLIQYYGNNIPHAEKDWWLDTAKVFWYNNDYIDSSNDLFVHYKYRDAIIAFIEQNS